MKTKPKPPKDLSPKAKKLWRDMQEEYEIDDTAGLHLLDEMSSAYDRALRAEETLKKEGMTILDRFGIPKPHPANSAYRDSKNVQLRCLRMLHDIGPTEEEK